LYNSNINLWFAKNTNNDIVTINEIEVKDNKEKYYCPLCGSEVIPKATKSKLITAHFAHVDASKCSSESMIHWWFKHKFLESGDKFKIVSDKEREYVCKEILVEQSYTVEDKIYRPDVTIKTECGNTIYFEMKFSNEKKLKDYIDIWLELKNIVVEVDIKKLMSKDKLPVFNALFYDGKCFNVKKRSDDGKYHDIIGKYKENILRKVDKIDDKLKERLQKLDWFWDDVFRYKKGEKDIEYMADLIDSIDEEDKDIVEDILKKPRCNNLYRKYEDFKYNKLKLRNINFCNNLINNYSNIIMLEGTYLYSLTDENKVLLGSINYNDLEELENYLKEKIEWCIEKENRYQIYKIVKNNTLIIDAINNINNIYKNIDKYYDFTIAERGSSCFFDFIVQLTYNNQYPLILSINIGKENIYTSNNLQEIEDFFKGRIEKTRIGKSSIVNVDNILNIIDELNNKISNINEHITFKHNFTDEGVITLNFNNKKRYEGYTSHYYHISNNGVRYNYDKNIIFNEFANFTDLKNILEKLIFNDLENDSCMTVYCKDCGVKFKLNPGEIEFYNKNGFKYPRRCKPCRNKRKLIKEGY